MTLRRLVRILGVATLVVLLFPWIVVVAMISVVGIPLGIALAASPTFFLLALGATAGRNLAKRETLAPALVGAAAMLALLAAGASGFNAMLHRTADALTAGDHDDLTRPLRAKTLAIVGRHPHRWPKGATRCDAICQRLLLSGEVERVLHAEPPREEKAGPDASTGGSPAPRWTAATEAVSFRFEKREPCPTVVLADAGEISAIEKGRSAAEEMRLAVASGRCLVEEAARLGDADFLLETSTPHRGAREMEAGLSPWADTVHAERLALFEAGPSGFVERYRWTGVETLEHPWILVPTVAGGSELRMVAAFSRSAVRRNPRPFAEQWHFEPDLGLFLRDDAHLGFSVTATAAAGTDRLAIVTAALDREGPLRPVDQRVIEDMFEELESFRYGRAKSADAAEAERREAIRRVALRAILDPRVIPPRRTMALVQATVDAGGADIAALASVLFERLATTDPELREDHPSYLGWPLDYLALAVSALPAEAVLPHREALERLAADPEARVRGSRALVQFSVFGADAAPTLLGLVDEAGRMKSAAPPKERDRDRWERPLRAALSAMCLAGPRAPEFPDALLERLRDGTLPWTPSLSGLLVSTFVQAGADPEPLRVFLAADASPDSSRSFDRMVIGARSHPRCEN